VAAEFGREVMSRYARDLHMYTRTTGWLLFGALRRSASFTELRTGSEECKYYEDDPDACPFKKREVPCDCSLLEDVSRVGIPLPIFCN